MLWGWGWNLLQGHFLHCPDSCSYDDEWGEHACAMCPQTCSENWQCHRRPWAWVPMVECTGKNVYPVPLALLAKQNLRYTSSFFPSRKSLNMFLSLSPRWFSLPPSFWLFPLETFMMEKMPLYLGREGKQRRIIISHKFSLTFDIEWYSLMTCDSDLGAFQTFLQLYTAISKEPWTANPTEANFFSA